MHQASFSSLCLISHDLVQRELVKIRFHWTEADADQNNELDIDEFLAFRHPEIAGNSYKHIVNDLMLRMGLLHFSDGEMTLITRVTAFQIATMIRN